MTTKNKIAFVIAIALTLLYGVLSIVFSRAFLSSIMSLVKVIPLIVLLYNINSRKKGRKTLLLVLSYPVFILLSFLEAFLNTHSSFGDTIIMSISSTFPLIPLILIITGREENKVTPGVISVVVAAATYIAFDWTNSTYYYLYASIEHYSMFLTYSKVLFLLAVLIPLSEVVFGSDNNYLSLSLMLASIIMSFPYYWASGMERWYINPLMLIFLLILLIYMSREGKKLEVGERRIVTFTRVADIEIEHLKKKKKERVYELPPNIPVDDRDKA